MVGTLQHAFQKNLSEMRVDSVIGRRRKEPQSRVKRGKFHLPSFLLFNTRGTSSCDCLKSTTAPPTCARWQDYPSAHAIKTTRLLPSLCLLHSSSLITSAFIVFAQLDIHVLDSVTRF